MKNNNQLKNNGMADLKLLTLDIKPRLSNDSKELNRKVSTADSQPNTEDQCYQSATMEVDEIENENNDEFTEIMKLFDRRLVKLQTRKDCLNLLSEENSAMLSNFNVGNLDTNVRKISSFIKKIKNFDGNSSSEIQNCMESEMLRFNLSKYIGEISTAVANLKLNKAYRASSIAHFCLLLSIRYANFRNELIQALEQSLQIIDDNRSPVQFRNEIRLLTEMILSGVFYTGQKQQHPEYKQPNHRAKSLLLKMLEKNTNHGSELKQFRHATVLLNFCKQYGDELADLMSRPANYSIKSLLADDRQKWKQLTLQKGYPDFLLDLSAVRKSSNIITDDESLKFRMIFLEYYDKLVAKTTQVMLELEHMRTSNAQILHARGDLGMEKRKAEEEHTSLSESLRFVATGFNELLCDDQISFHFTSEADENCHVTENRLSIDYEDYNWDREEDRKFYRHLPDLSTILLSATKKNDPLKEKAKPGDAQRTEQREAAVKSSSKQMDNQTTETFDSFLTELSKQNTKRLIDQKCVEFYIHFNSRSNRNRLIQHLSRLMRVHNEVLPFYARLTASLSQYHSNIGIELSNTIVKQFKYQLRKKDQINLEMKLKRMRYISELIKFELISKHDALQLIKLLLNNFVHHNIEMCCTLLETCGHFLYQSKSSHTRCHAYMEIMMRKMNAHHFNDRYRVLIENAFNVCRPQQPSTDLIKGRAGDKEQPRSHHFILYVLTSKLAKVSAFKLADTLEKLDWTNDEMYMFALDCFASPYLVRFNHIIHLANLLSELNSGFLKYFIVQVIDVVIESMLIHHLQESFYLNRVDNQKLICLARYFAEFYNYALIDYFTLVKVLFTLISPTNGEIEDPPHSLIRIRMICSILVLAGPRLESGDDLEAVCQFTYYFQCYFWMKRSNQFWSMQAHFPEDVEQFVYDAVRKVDKNLAISRSLLEAIEQRNLNCPSFDENDADSTSSTSTVKVSTNNDEQIDHVFDHVVDEKDIIADREILNLFDQHVQSQHRERTNDTADTSKRKNNESFSLPLFTTMSRSINHISRFGQATSGNYNKSQENHAMCFRLLSMRNNKPQLQPVDIPLSSDVYEKILEEKRIASIEREELKRLTLNISEMQLIEDQQHGDFEL
ncbi:hypothetical protein GJ496_001639 [Pomphorhynchus laevis]|nr:hypothetical protein GJ496_001639 [Pomphorhynchus laevis]